MASFGPAFALFAHIEGGFVDDPNDGGGPTKYGISLRFLQDPEVDGDIDKDGDEDIDDIRKLTSNDVARLVRAKFWEPLLLGNLISQPLATKVFLCATNMGRTPAVRLLQRALNSMGAQMEIDGILGTRTLLNANTYPAFTLHELLCLEAVKFYRALRLKNPKKYGKYFAGWVERCLL